MRLAPLTGLLAGSLLSSTTATAQIVSVTLQGPARDFGRFPGDMLTSTATITVMPGTVLDENALPQPGAVSPLADMRHVALGGTATRLEIQVTYQVFFAPDQVSGADIPGYSLVFSAQGKRITATVPGFGFTASPFRHDLQPTLDPASMRPDHLPQAAAAPGAIWAIAAGLPLMIAGLLALVWPWAPLRRVGPFAAAASHVRKVSGKAAHEMFPALHRAFDATAGRHVFADDIDDFLREHPHFVPLRIRILLFFAASQTVFFDGADSAMGEAEWRALCNGLARAERGA